MTTKKNSSKKNSTTTSTMAPKTEPTYPGFEPYDIFQVYSEAGWTDYDTIRTEEDAAFALKKVQASRTGEYRIVSADRTLVKVPPALQPQRPARKGKSAAEAKQRDRRAQRATQAPTKPTETPQNEQPETPAEATPEPTNGIEVTGVQVGEATLTERGKQVTEELAQVKSKGKAKKKTKVAPEPAEPATEPTGPTTAKMSALDAAARVLEESGQAMSVKELIAQMADQGYWTSPAGKTPAATLSSALQREIKTKGKDSRFKKTAPGRFAHA